MPARYHHIDFETEVESGKGVLPVKVEATISEYGGHVQIEGVKVFLQGGNTELVLSDEQMKEIYEEVFDMFS